MIRLSIIAYLLFVCTAILSACGSTPNSKPVVLRSDDAPCWIRRPDCVAKPGDDALYFVGQSAEALASWGRPVRASVHSAQSDAEQQYARFLGVEIRSSIFLQRVLDDEQYQSQFNHTLSSNVNRTVSDLVKADEYFAAYEQTSEGQPKWTVYVLIKIGRATVAKHRAAIEEEVKRLANAPAPEVKWTAHVYNIDDGAAISVNGQTITRCGFSRSCTVNLNPHLKNGINEVRLDFMNRLLFWTYGYEIKKNDDVMYEGRCGQVWVYGCSFNTDKGVVHTRTFKIEHRPLDSRNISERGMEK